MEKLIMKPYDKEFMKMAILKHEETFKQQVYELHRLYQIQKSLMRSLRTKPSIDQININNSLQGFLDLEKPAIEDGLELEMEEESEIELTLGPSNNYYKSTKTAEPRSRTSSFSSSTSTTGSRNVKRKTINISARINERNREELSFDDHVEKEDKMIKHHPHWLYQTLSLNMT